MENLRVVAGRFARRLLLTDPQELAAARETELARIAQRPGDTPLKECSFPKSGVRLFAKEETCNDPTGTHYDRVYPPLFRIIAEAGLTPDNVELAETSSGSAAPAFGVLARELGYRSVAFLPGELSPARRSFSEAQCDEVVVADPKRDGWGVVGASKAMRDALEESRQRWRQEGGKRLFTLNHSRVPESLEAISSLAAEAVQQVKGERIHYCVLVAGNGTVLNGVGQAIKDLAPGVEIIAVEPRDRPVFFEMRYPGAFKQRYGEAPPTLADMEGRDFYAPGMGGVGIDCPFLEAAISIVDDVILVDRDTCGEVQQELFKQGEMVGTTSALSHAAAREVAKSCAGGNILIIHYDSADKY
ncbi:pyridoxal-phosphate dependent enzyme [bacterium]|nr:pyridoxal-phosphate dependent enzyme [bacterium]